MKHKLDHLKLPVQFGIIALLAALWACGGSSGGGNLTVQGNLSSAIATRTLRDGAGPGIPNVIVSALGDSTVTDDNGDFTLDVDAPAAGSATFEFSGEGINTTSVVDPFPSNGGTVVVHFTTDSSGSIKGEVVAGGDDGGGDTGSGDTGGDTGSGDTGGDTGSGDTGGDTGSGDTGGDTGSGDTGGDTGSGDTGGDTGSGDTGGDTGSGDTGGDTGSGDTGGDTGSGDTGGGGAPATLVTFGSNWKYLDNGSDQGTAWQSTGYDDSTWASGPGELGFGDGDEATIVSFGADPANKITTTYFRHTFNVADASALNTLDLSVIRDDGVAVYLNGVEIFRQNLDPGASFNTFAIQPVALEFEFTPATSSIPAGGLLVNGSNVLAVEMHQSDLTSSDLSFDLQLIGLP